MQSTRDRSLFAGALCAILFTYLGRAWIRLDSVVDDAYISGRYAEQFALGHGLVYNAGEPPVEGYTNLAFVILSALTYRCGVDMHTVVVGWGLVFGALGLLAITALTHQLIGRASFWALVPAAWLAIDMHYAVVATNGIESSMFICAVSACAAAVLAAGQGSWAVGLAAALCGLIVAVRPEGLAVAGALAGYDLWARRTAGPSRWAVACGFLAGALPVWFGRRWYFGEWVPNTFAAKDHRDIGEQILFNLRYLSADAPFWIAIALLFGIGLWPKGLNPRRAIVACVAGGLILVAFRVDMWMPGGRLLLPAVGLILPLFVSRLAEIRGAKATGLAAFSCFALAIPLAVGPLPDHVLDYDDHHTAMPGNPAEMAARHLRKYAPPSATLATRDAGVVAYYVGPDVRMAELHERALTQPHPNGKNAAIREYTPKNPEFFLPTVQRETAPRSKYGGDTVIWNGLTAEYVYLGRVKQHYHRYYDVYVRADLNIPPLPPEIVVNRAGQKPKRVAGAPSETPPPEPIEADSDTDLQP